MNKTLTILFLFFIQNSYSQDFNWSLSECIVKSSEVNYSNIKSKYKEEDSIIIDFVINANCSGIHDFKTLLSNDTLFIDFKQGTLSLIDSIIVGDEQVIIFDSIKQNNDTIVKTMYMYTQSLDIAECNCYYNLKLSYLESLKLTGLSFICVNRKNYLKLEKTEN